MKRVGGMAILALVLVGGVTGMALAGEETAVEVDLAEAAGPLPRLAGHLNNSLRYAPPPRLAKLAEQEFGKPKIMRCWLCLDDLWDYRDGTYYYNHQIGKDIYADDQVKSCYDRRRVTETDVHYYDYLDAFSRSAKSLLLNIRRYETEVVKGVISMEQWREVVKNGLRHYKRRCPNIKYIEVLNESEVKHFGGLTKNEYYQFYRETYELVGELNDELKPEVPLLVGGPTWHEDTIKAFIERYAADTNPRKRLDFLTYHRYTTQPTAFLDVERRVDAWLKQHDLPEDIPIFITEFGNAFRVGKSAPLPVGQLLQAQMFCSVLYSTRSQPDLIGFPWVLYHDPHVQSHFVMFTKDLRMTPAGAAIKMLSLHRDTEVAVQTSSRRDRDGRGLYAMASKDEEAAVVQVWNYSDTPRHVEVRIKGLPPAWRQASLSAGQFLIDGQHSNCIAQPQFEGGLEQVATSTLSAGTPPQFSVELQANALWLVQLEQLEEQK